MGRQNTKISSARLLLNAEPFGFGPSAAIASVFPHLCEAFEVVSYVGKHHTLDLQNGLDYTAIHDVSHMCKEEREDVLIPLMRNYDIFVSAMDHKMVEIAQKAGLKTLYYDALTWYWKDIPLSVRRADLYMAQDFFGVSQRLSDIFGAQATNTAIVPPIVSPIESAAQHIRKDHVLINLGGLQNPYWDVESIGSFAEKVVSLAKASIPENEKVVVACSHAVAQRLNRADVQTCSRAFSRAEMLGVLSRAKWAFMTPGLGNIYDAAAYNIPTIWLPPANDSQGQQLRLLGAHNMQDAELDWHHFMDGEAIDYTAEQLSVLNDISAKAARFSHDKTVQKAFAVAVNRAARAVRVAKTTKTARLLAKFGTGGEAQIASHIKRFAGTCCRSV